MRYGKSFILVVTQLLIIFWSMQADAGEKSRRAPAPVPQTGQTISFSVGDDGDLQIGVVWPDPRFTDNDNGTVTDNLTGLMWTKDVPKFNGVMTWDDALTACNNLVFAGHNDWRLPNVRELHSLIDYSQLNPALPSGHPFIFDWTQFPYSELFFWSSTTAPYSGTIIAWMVLMDSGKIQTYVKAGIAGSVWPVRGGK